MIRSVRTTAITEAMDTGSEDKSKQGYIKIEVKTLTDTKIENERHAVPHKQLPKLFVPKPVELLASKRMIRIDHDLEIVPSILSSTGTVSLPCLFSTLSV